MRFIFSLAFTTITFYSFAQNNIDVLHYRFHIGLNDANDTLHGVAIIDFAVKEETSSIRFDLTSLKKEGKGMIVTTLGYKSSEIIPQPQFKQELEHLVINSSLFKKGDTATIIINYKGIPSDGFIISKNKYGHRTFFADNWPNLGHNWLPCHDDPADKASVEFIVTAPDHYQVVANGIQVEESSLQNGNKQTHWKEDVPVSTKVMVIGVAEFAVNLTGYVNDCIPVYAWVYPEDKEKGFYDFAITKDILSFFIKQIGPYGYKKLANVQSKTKFGGLENANTIFYAEGNITGNRSKEELYAHEIAHQWFGNMATEKSFGHLWLSEGFATFFATYYMEEKYGKEKGIAMRQEDREQVITYHSKNNLKTVVDTSITDFMKMLNPYSYQKGGWVLHMLRFQLGDSVFFRAIRNYYATYAGGIAGTDDLRKIFETVSGKDLKQFFNQWLYTPGLPDVKIKWKYNPVTKKTDIEIVQQQKNSFSFPLTIAVKLASGKILKQTLEVHKQAATFSLLLKEKPVELKADPDSELLFSAYIEAGK